MTLKDYLKQKKFKQLMLAKETGISATKLSLFFNGWDKLEEFELKKLSKSLGVSMAEISSNSIKERA